MRPEGLGKLIKLPNPYGLVTHPVDIYYNLPSIYANSIHTSMSGNITLV
jgi:hypothetical protein